MNKNLISLFFLILLLFILNYSFLDSLLIDFLEDGEKIFIDRVIDGDIVVSNGTSIRLLGINAPERGETYSAEAKKFLEDMVLNKTVGIKIIGKDRYYRELAYLFIGSRNVNLELVKKGLSNFYFPSGKDAYYDEFVLAWDECLGLRVNLCERSKDTCGSCVELSEWDVKAQRVTLRNDCGVMCNLDGWGIKDEGRKNFVFEDFILEDKKSVEIIVGDGRDSANKLFWAGEKYVWTKGGDSIFVRDENGGLVIFNNY
ncbi:thermonuclease family protein [Candidatus Pacearchaeota archaeon]|nr:thermonuclease family protein [Candidatus Pacearchaeota archaeon]